MTLLNQSYDTIMNNVNFVDKFSSNFVSFCAAEENPKYYMYGHNDVVAVIATAHAWMQEHGTGWAYAAIYDRSKDEIVGCMRRLEPGQEVDYEEITDAIKCELNCYQLMRRST